jgi:hypothetical protein
VHARADNGDGVVARLRHSAGDHLGLDGRDATYVLWVDDPTVDARERFDPGREGLPSWRRHSHRDRRGHKLPRDCQPILPDRLGQGFQLPEREVGCDFDLAHGVLEKARNLAALEMPVADLGQRIGKSTRLLKVARQRRLDGRDPLVQLVRRRGTLDALALGGELAFGFGLVLCEDSERVIDARQVGRCRDDGSLHFVERSLIVDVARQERLLSGLDRLVQSVLSGDAFGGELLAALRERGDGGFEWLHRSFSEEVFHAASLRWRNVICVDRARGALHIRCRLLWRAPHFGAFARAGMAEKMNLAGGALGAFCPVKPTLLARPARSEKCQTQTWADNAC